MKEDQRGDSPFMSTRRCSESCSSELAKGGDEMRGSERDRRLNGIAESRGRGACSLVEEVKRLKRGTL